MAIQTVQATFTSSTSQSVTWSAYTTTTAFGLVHGAVVVSGSNPTITMSAVSAGGGTIAASSAFTGTVNLIVFDLD